MNGKLGGLEMMRCWLMRMGFALCMVALSLCAQEKSGSVKAPPAQGGSEGVFYFLSHTGAGDPFWVDEFKGAMLAAQEVGMDLRITAPERPMDIERQLELLNVAITPGTKGIATTVSDPKRFSPYLKKAEKMGIPVIVYNTVPADFDRAANPYMAYVGMDEGAAGEIVGKRVLASGRVKKRLLVVTHSLLHPGLKNRYLGIKKAMADSTVALDLLEVTYEPDVISQAFLDYVSKHPDLDGVVCLGTASLREVANIIKVKSLGLYCASFDYSRCAAHHISAGVVDFVIDQQPLIQGYLAVIFMHLKDKYALTPLDVDTGTVVRTKKNLKREPKPDDASTITLLSHAGAGDTFWRREIKGATDAARESKITFRFVAPEVPNDHARQYQLLNETLKAKPRVLGMTVPSATVFSTALKAMRKKGVVVVAVNSRPIDDDRSKNPYHAYVGMDDLLAGQLAGKRVLASGEVKKHVVVANHSFGHSGLAARVKGLRDVLEPKGIKVTDLDVTIEPSAIVAVLREFLKRHPDVDAVASVGGPSVTAVGEAIQGGAKGYYWFAFDLNPTVVHCIENGTLDFSIDQQPYMQGYLLVKMLMLALRYDQLPPDVDTGGGIIDRDNVKRVKKLVSSFIR